MRSLPVTDVKAGLNALIDDVVATHEPVTITRHGRPAAMLISVEDVESLIETASWLADPDTLPEVAEAMADIAAGRTFSVDEVREQLRAARG